MEQRTKERLVGAAALVLIVVIVVPELLTGPRPPPAREPTDVRTVRTVTIDLAASEHGAIDRPPAAPEVALPPPTTPAAIAGEGTPPAPAAPTSTPKPSAEAPRPEASAPEKATPAATVTAAAPPAAPAPAATAPLNPPPSAVRSATPPPHPEAAKSEPPKPATTAAGAKPAASTHTRWIVQVGSFSSKARARALVANLKSGGYKATLSEVHSGGQVLYRVRLAPETERARANELSARLVREGHRAVVVPES